MAEIVQQIKGRNVARRKFPFLLKEGVIFPPNLNLEQASSQATAAFKARGLHGSAFLDLTAGFGIDAFFLSESFNEVTLVERDPVLGETVRHNWEVLGRKANFIENDLETFLKNNQQRFDLIYLDPARRDAQARKRFLLEDLSPNIIDIQQELLRISDRVMIKLSPLIDISYLQSVLQNCVQIDLIAVRNEVKELIAHLRSNPGCENLSIHCYNIETSDPPFIFNEIERKQSTAVYGNLSRYLYIPNNAVLKSGAFNLLSKRFGLNKLDVNTHLYTSKEFMADFPGRCIETETIAAGTLRKGEQYNIISKNHPLTPDQIRKKYGIRDGGDSYLIFTQALGKKVILRSVQNEA